MAGASVTINIGAAIQEQLSRYEGTVSVLGEVLREREAQDVRWGEQNHTVLGGIAMSPDNRRRVYAQEASRYKAINDVYAKNGNLGWDTILLEEVYEALSEPDSFALEEELIQVAAVAVAAVESIRRNRSAA